MLLPGDHFYLHDEHQGVGRNGNLRWTSTSSVFASPFLEACWRVVPRWSDAASARLRSGDSQLGMMTAKAISVTSRPASIFRDSLTVDLGHLACQLKIKSCFLKKTLDFETEGLVYRCSSLARASDTLE